MCFLEAADQSVDQSVGHSVSQVGVSLAAAEDALLAGALIGRAEPNEQPSLLVFLLLLQAIVGLSFKRFAPQVGGGCRFQAQLLLYHLPEEEEEEKHTRDEQLD